MTAGGPSQSSSNAPPTGSTHDGSGVAGCVDTPQALGITTNKLICAVCRPVRIIMLCLSPYYAFRFLYYASWFYLFCLF